MTTRAESEAGASAASRAGRRWSWAFAAALAVGTALSFGGRAGWMLELLSHFRAQLLFASLTLLALFALCRSGRGVVAALLLVAVNGAPAAPLFVAPERAASATAGAPLRLLIANVHSANGQHQRLIELVRAERPDILLLQEVTASWLASLEALADEYPHRLARPREDNFGLAVLSARPFLRAELRAFGREELTWAELAVEHDGAPLAIVLVHTFPPVGAERAALRDAHALEVAALAARLGPRTVLAGDLNMTRWSPAFADVLATSGLADSARGFGLQPTWPTSLPWPLRIGIDHCLHGPGLEVVERRLGPDIGSDHLPLLVELR